MLEMYIIIVFHTNSNSVVVLGVFPWNCHLIRGVAGLCPPRVGVGRSHARPVAVVVAAEGDEDNVESQQCRNSNQPILLKPHGLQDAINFVVIGVCHKTGVSRVGVKETPSRGGAVLEGGQQMAWERAEKDFPALLVHAAGSIHDNPIFMMEAAATGNHE